MRNVVTSLAFLMAVFLVSCKQSSNSTDATSTEAKAGNEEVSLEQKPLELKDDQGKSVTVIYFAKGDQVAVRLKLDGKEHELVAKGVTKAGNPIFTDEEVMWEMLADGHSGKLTKKDNTSSVFKEVD